MWIYVTLQTLQCAGILFNIFLLLIFEAGTICFESENASKMSRAIYAVPSFTEKIALDMIRGGTVLETCLLLRLTL